MTTTLAPAVAQSQGIQLGSIEQVLAQGDLAKMTAEDRTPIGTIRSGHDIGYKNRGRFIWSACRTCGKERWVPFRLNGNECVKCAPLRTVKFAQAKILRSRPDMAEKQRREGNPGWRGGRTTNGNGYIYYLIEPGDPYASMANREGRVMEHRLFMARHLGRALSSTEQVHHINGKRDDNRIENLELWNQSHPKGVRQADYHCPGCRCFEHAGGAE